MLPLIEYPNDTCEFLLLFIIVMLSDKMHAFYVSDKATEFLKDHICAVPSIKLTKILLN